MLSMNNLPAVVLCKVENPALLPDPAPGFHFFGSPGTAHRLSRYHAILSSRPSRRPCSRSESQQRIRARTVRRRMHHITWPGWIMHGNNVRAEQVLQGFNQFQDRDSIPPPYVVRRPHRGQLARRAHTRFASTTSVTKVKSRLC